MSNAPPTSAPRVLAPLVVRAQGRVASAFGGNRVLLIGSVMLGLLVLAAILAPVLSPDDPRAQDVTQALEPPLTPGHPLGTDDLGRDVLSRILYGARADLFVGCGAVLLPLLIGTILGGIAAYRGGWVDLVIMRVVDLVFAFPILVLLLALVFVMGPGIVSIIVAVTIVDWVAYARLSRALVRSEKGKGYVLAAQVGGLPSRRILWRHVLPNVIRQPIVYAFSDAVLVILAITTLGFLGLGIPPPAPDWGTMIADAQPFVGIAWWTAVFPGLAILITGISLFLVSDGLAEGLRSN